MKAVAVFIDFGFLLFDYVILWEFIVVWGERGFRVFRVCSMIGLAIVVGRGYEGFISFGVGLLGDLEIIN